MPDTSLAPPSVAPAQVSAAASEPTHPALEDGPIAMITADNPKFPRDQNLSHEALGQALQKLGLKTEVTQGQYDGIPERSYIVYGAPVEHMRQLGKQFGQESVVIRMNGKNFLLYTNGEHEGHATKPAAGYELYNTETKPGDAFTALPHKEGEPPRFVRYNIDFSGHVPVEQLHSHLHKVAPAEAGLAVLKAAVSAYHQVLLDLRARELAKVEDTVLQPEKTDGKVMDSRVFNLVKSQVCRGTKLSKSEAGAALVQALRLKGTKLDCTKSEPCSKDVPKAAGIKTVPQTASAGAIKKDKSLAKEEMGAGMGGDAAPKAAPKASNAPAPRPAGVPKAPKPPQAPGAMPSMHKAAPSESKQQQQDQAVGTPSDGKAAVSKPIDPKAAAVESFRPASPGAAGGMPSVPKAKSPAGLKLKR